MVEETPQINPVDPGPVPDAASPWQTNGVFTEPTFAPPETADPEATVDADGAAEEATEPAEDGIAADVTEGGPAEIDDGTVFLASLAKAMHHAASTERARITEDIDRRSETHIARINARRDEEAARMRELADDDRKAVDAWVEEEQRRIAGERDRRNAAIESDLVTSLAEHGTQVDREIERVEAAIAVYREDVDAYFTNLEGDDPVAIAQHAGRRPAFPDLTALAVVAEATPDVAAVAEMTGEETSVVATAEPQADDVPVDDAADAEPAAAAAEPAGEAAAPGTPLIGVMEVDRPRTKLAQAWATWNESTRTADQAAEAAQAAEVPAAPFTLKPPKPVETATEPSTTEAANPRDEAATEPATEPATDVADPAAAGSDTGAAEAEDVDDAPTQIPVAAGTWKPPTEISNEPPSSLGAMGWFRRDRDRDHGGR